MGCNLKRTFCRIGKYTMHSTNPKQPLYISDDYRVVCNYKQTSCTDGYEKVNSLSKIKVRASSGINYHEKAHCNANRTTCLIKNHKMHSSYPTRPLYVTKDGSVVCNYQRTKCTDGFTMKTTVAPMY